MLTDNLARAKAMSEEEILANALNDPDAPPLTDEQLKGFIPLSSLAGNTLVERLHNLKKRALKQSLTVRYDADLVAYYKAKGKGYQKAMNNALRVCMEAEKGLLR